MKKTFCVVLTSLVALVSAVSAVSTFRFYGSKNLVYLVLDSGIAKADNTGENPNSEEKKDPTEETRTQIETHTHEIITHYKFDAKAGVWIFTSVEAEAERTEKETITEQIPVEYSRIACPLGSHTDCTETQWCKI